MEVSQKVLCLLFLVSVGAGVLLGMVYDVLRLTRMLVGLQQPSQVSLISPAHVSKKAVWQRRCGHVLLFLEDLLFGVLCGVVGILILYFVNDGQVRFLTPVGMFCGFFVYTVTIGKIIRGLSDAIVAFLRKVVRCILKWLYHLIMTPLRWIYRGLDHLILSKARKCIEQRKQQKRVKQTQKLNQIFIQQAENCFGLFDEATGAEIPQK